MKQALKNSGVTVNRLLNKYASDRKKAVLAVCLIVVMAFMWIRLISKKAPKSANAAPTTVTTTDVAVSESDSGTEVSFAELPYIKGRNDMLTRDFFVSEKVESDEVQTTAVISEDTHEDYAEKVAANLKLEAIGLGDNPQAFINNKLLSVGDKLFVSDGANTYECEVVRIEENIVLIKYGEAEIQLKLTQVNETKD